MTQQHFPRESVAVREAEARDLPDLRRRACEVVDYGEFDWRERIEKPNEYRTIVAELAGGRTIGHASAGPPQLPRNNVLRDFRPLTERKTNLAAPLWCKLDLIAVDTRWQGRGVGHQLLQAIMEWLPTSKVGLYGNVDSTSSAAIAWYQRQGFSIAAAAALSDRPGSSTKGVIMQPLPTELMFRGYRGTVTDHLQGRGRAGWEERDAQAEHKRLIHNLTTGRSRPRGDTGYRRLARQIADTPNTTSCPHMRFGPRTAWVYGWDPQHQHSCVFCHEQNAVDIAAFDDEDLCDACRRRTSDVQLSWASLDKEMMLVFAGLCPGCRAGRF